MNAIFNFLTCLTIAASFSVSANAGDGPGNSEEGQILIHLDEETVGLNEKMTAKFADFINGETKSLVLLGRSVRNCSVDSTEFLKKLNASFVDVNVVSTMTSNNLLTLSSTSTVLKVSDLTEVQYKRKFATVLAKHCGGDHLMYGRSVYRAHLEATQGK